MNNKIKGYSALALAASIWGGMYVASKYVLDVIPPFTLVWLRYSISLIFLYIIYRIQKSKKASTYKLTRNDWIHVILIGFIGYFFSISCQFIGTDLSNAHTGSLITAATPAFMVIFARVILKESLTLKKILSLLLSSVGVLIITGFNNQQKEIFLGSIILILAAISWALMSVLVRKISYKLSSVAITMYGFFFALIFTTPFMIWECYNTSILYINFDIILAVLYLCVISTAGAFLLWNYGLSKVEAGIGSLFFFFQPIVGTILGFLLLNETITTNFYIGGLLILFSIFIITTKSKNNKHLNNSKKNV